VNWRAGAGSGLLQRTKKPSRQLVKRDWQLSDTLSGGVESRAHYRSSGTRNADLADTARAHGKTATAPWVMVATLSPNPDSKVIVQATCCPSVRVHRTVRTQAVIYNEMQPGRAGPLVLRVTIPRNFWRAPTRTVARARSGVTTQSPNGLYFRTFGAFDGTHGCTKPVRTEIHRQAIPRHGARHPVNIQTTLYGLRALGLGLIAGLVICAPAHADGGGHIGAVGHAGGVGFHGGGVRGFARFHGGFRDRFVFRGGFGCCFWPGYGLFLATLPFYYSTLWWNGVPYYYADDNYYVWNNSMGGYQAVVPPLQVMNQAAVQRGGTDLFAYPKNGQSVEQQASDRQECRNWATSQTSPSTITTGVAPGAASPSVAAATPNSEANLRAQAACLEGHGYSVK
jgi:hypothetical protein